jgi:hypothetical protein
VKSQSSDESQESDVVARNAESQQEEIEQQAQDDTNYDDYIVNNHNREIFIERDTLQWEDSPHPSSCSETHDDNHNHIPTGPIGQPLEEPTQIIGPPGHRPTQVDIQVASEEEQTQPASSPTSPDNAKVCIF